MGWKQGQMAAVVWVAMILAIPAVACAQVPVVETDASIVEGEKLLPRNGIGAVPGVFVGHATLEERATGCTVILTPDGATAGVDVRGGAPSTRDTEFMDPANMIQDAHAIVLAGGSTFGLAAADGASRYLEERGVGVQFGGLSIPIVSAAILFDLSVGDPSIRPGPECGYEAADNAMRAGGPVAEGSVGAGAGATVGKLRGMDGAVKGGIGTASIELSNGLIVAAIVAVNAVGDVIDPATGQVVAGVRGADGGFLDARRLLREGQPPAALPVRNTTIGVVATNARLSQAEATRVARMAQDGLARAISPTHTPYDGDTIFALATGGLEGDPDVLTIGALAADMVAESILRAVFAAEGVEGIPSLTDLSRQ